MVSSWTASFLTLHTDALCDERLNTVFASFDISSRVGGGIEGALSILQLLSGDIALKVIKTWLNAWATSRRMHEDPILKCLFGCSDGEDNLAHYVMCPYVYALQSFLFEDTSSLL